MKGILVLLLAVGALFFFPSTALADPPDCSLTLYAAGDKPCWQSPDPARAEAENAVYLPAVQLSVAAPAAAQIPVTGEVESASPAASGADRQAYHVVQPAETLVKIAKMHAVPADALLMANPQIVNPHLIHIGDELRIPAADEIERLRSEAAARRIAEQRQIAANVPHRGQRWIDVDLQTQTVRAYEGDTVVNTFIASTGLPRTPTVTGQFRVWVKFKTDDMKGPGYDLKAVPYVLYFFEDYALHGTYWHNNFGTPMSHGCVNLRTEDAQWLYDFADVGTLVNVH